MLDRIEEYNDKENEADSYFYAFLEPISPKMAQLAKELENTIFNSPRMMLTHSRVLSEYILKQVIKIKKFEEPADNLLDRINLLQHKGCLSEDICNALHHVRKMGNQAAHETRAFRFSEALLSWEALYKIIKWYVDTYGDAKFKVPLYQDPLPTNQNQSATEEIEDRLQSLEELLMSLKEREEGKEEEEEEVQGDENRVIRAISYQGQQIDIPYFLRDIYLLPQRFPHAEKFLIRLGAEQQVRVMSELPSNLNDLKQHLKRNQEQNIENLFKDLKIFVEEEVERKRMQTENEGKLFLFFKDQCIVITDELSIIKLSNNEFRGIPQLIRQLNEDDICTVGQLPKELVILTKYDKVGKGTVEKLFNQLIEKQKNMQEAAVQ
ncbi:DUF4145 domain-containing protein [Rummeliibacillus sp. TYF-LIM-RU47]|uniref:DUF4145 domain-containing protein n=1 Tax=Rummeliibacillus sp. TYF-LIM-RU47 TaxID=2608406 RepID=UPI0012394A08|nr:DUF4145 domain-containing protein [Rummeliibacillus sp. TYF-LIM-RU47]